MALGTGHSVEDRTQAVGRIVNPFELKLVEHKGIARGLSHPVTDGWGGRDSVSVVEL
jgi:hypothetical protein